MIPHHMADAQGGAARGTGTKAGPGPAMRILIVDDIEEMRLTLRRMLARGNSAITVDMAAGGDEALDLLRRAKEAGQRYDAICLDLMMPGMGGVETLRRIRAEALVDRFQTGLFVLSGHDEIHAIRDAKSLGVLEVLKKPISAAELGNLIRRWLSFRGRYCA